MVEAYTVSDLGRGLLSRPLCFCVDPAVIRSFDPRSIRRADGKKGVCQYASMCLRCDPSLRSLCAYNVEKGAAV